MSKVVRKINKTAKKVFIDKPKELAKKVWKSKIGRAIVIAAAIYFTYGAASAYFTPAAAAASGGTVAMGEMAGIAGSAGYGAAAGSSLAQAGLGAAAGAAGSAAGGAAAGYGSEAALMAASPESFGLAAQTGAAQGLGASTASGIAPAMSEMAGAVGGAAESGGLISGAMPAMGDMAGGIAAQAPAAAAQAPLGSVLPSSTVPGAGSAAEAAMTAVSPEASGMVAQVGANGAPLGQQAGGLVNSMMNGAKTVGDFMAKNKLYGTALQFGGNLMSSYARQKAEEEAIARRRQEIINGYRSGFGQQLWRY